jgi:cephalosporin hydroxylase
MVCKSSSNTARGWRKPAEARPDLNSDGQDLQRAFFSAPANSRWYDQTSPDVPDFEVPDHLVALQRILLEAAPEWTIATEAKFGGTAILLKSVLSMMRQTPQGGQSA